MCIRDRACDAAGADIAQPATYQIAAIGQKGRMHPGQIARLYPVVTIDKGDEFPPRQIKAAIARGRKPAIGIRKNADARIA